MNDKKFQKKLAKIQKRGEQYKQEYELKAAYEKYVPEKKKKKVSNIMLVVVIVAIAAYTIANFWLTYVSGVTVDSTLTTCFYAFFGSELFLLAGIKTSKVLKGTDESQYDWCANSDDESEM